MKSAYAARRGPSPLTVVTFALFALLIGSALTVGTLWILGVDLPFLSRKVAAAPSPPIKRTGTPVPLCARAIPAYTKLSRDDFLDPKTGDLVVYYLSEREIKDRGLITDVRDLLDRVTARAKEPGYAFTDKDLFPKGTRPGLVAGIPAGKRAFVLLADKIQGIHALKAGDRFDIVGSLPVDIDKALAKFKSANHLDPLPAPDGVGQSPKRANVKVLVQNGAVVVPVTIREVPTGAAAAGKGAKLPTKPVQEITIAVDPEEVAVLSEALAVSANVVCVARSGQPDDPGASSITPGSNPGPKLRTMETIGGGKRQTLIFPGPGQAPQPAPEAAPEQVPPSPTSTSPTSKAQ